MFSVQHSPKFCPVRTGRRTGNAQHSPKFCPRRTGRRRGIAQHSPKLSPLRTSRRKVIARHSPKFCPLRTGRRTATSQHSPKFCPLRTGRRTVTSQHSPKFCSLEMGLKTRYTPEPCSAPKISNQTRSRRLLMIRMSLMDRALKKMSPEDDVSRVNLQITQRTLQNDYCRQKTKSPGLNTG